MFVTNSARDPSWLRTDAQIGTTCQATRDRTREDEGVSATVSDLCARLSSSLCIVGPGKWNGSTLYETLLLLLLLLLGLRFLLFSDFQIPKSFPFSTDRN